jgi:cation transport protein ChaC
MKTSTGIAKRHGERGLTDGAGELIRQPVFNHGRTHRPLPVKIRDVTLAVMGEFWIFGYGSLMWRPGFSYRERADARLNGYHRSLCVLSQVHRGTPDKPGLVLGLDRGGACRGVVFQIAPEEQEATLAYLREREMMNYVYREAMLPVRLLDGSNRVVSALAYVVDRKHRQYSGPRSLDEVVALVRQGHGKSGPNRDYVHATHDALLAMGVRDHALETVLKRLEA